MTRTLTYTFHRAFRRISGGLGSRLGYLRRAMKTPGGCFHRAAVIIFIFLFTIRCPAVANEAIPASAYFPLLPFEAANDALPQWIPIASNHPMEAAHNGIDRAIIVIHDETRDANAALSLMSALAGSMNATTMIVAPQFLMPSDIVGFAEHLPDNGRSFAAWQMLGWPSGEDSMPVSGRKSVSSFAAVDLLLMYLSDRNSFPALREIVIAGFGAGANFTQRYAAFGVAPNRLMKQNVSLRFVVAGATSYIYQTPYRPLGGRKGFGQPNASSCPNYNSYPYGIEKLNPYTRRTGANSAKMDYALRFITYVGTPDRETMQDAGCQALTQGKNAAERMENYRMYMQALYNEVAAKTQTFAVAKDAKNTPAGLLGSACSMTALFSDGHCTPSLGGVQ